MTRTPSWRSCSALTRIYKVTRAAARRALALYRDNNVDFVDALVAATAHELECRVFSFDAASQHPGRPLDAVAF